MRARRVKDLFDRALDEAPERRAAFLGGACGPDTRREVERLLDAHDRVAGFLERPASRLLQERTLEKGARVGAYTIVRLLGAGGGGTIYEAEQRSPSRRVALKVMAAGLASDTAQRRFRDEAEILARLRHPGIATVYEAGVHDGVPFFALEYVEGARTVTRHAREASLGVRARLELFARVCDAVHHGHQKGVVHRDLKPGNVLVDRAGQPRVIDFGIAKLAGERGAELAGTLPYMSPEQCDGAADVDVRSDVYSLGVLLYELLMGRLPHDLDGVAITEATRRIREEAPAPVDRRFRGDVEAVLGKALAKDREARYASASALAADVRRHLGHHPVAARPGGFLYHGGRFARRHRAAVAAAAAFVALLAAAAIVASGLAIARERQRKEARMQAYVASVAAAQAALRADDVAEARQRLAEAPPEHRNWEWYHLRGLLDSSVRTLEWPGAAIYTGAASRDGSLLAASSMPGGLRVWNTKGDVAWELPDGGARVDALDFDPTARLLACGRLDGRLEIRDAATGRALVSLNAHDEGVNAVRFSPSGDRLATGGRDAVVALWDPTTGRRLGALRGHEDRLIDLCFDARGEQLATASRDGTARLWDLAAGETRTVFRGHRGSVESVALSPDGVRLATSSRDRSIRLWDTATGNVLEVWQGHASNVRAALFAPDGETVVSASYDSTLRLWRAPLGEAGCLRGHTAGVMALALQGPHVLSFGQEGTVKWWEPDRAGSALALRGHRDGITALAFDPGGARLASGGLDGHVRIWDAVGAAVADLDAGASVTDVHFLGPGRLLTLGSVDVVRAWDLASGTMLFERRLPASRAAGRADRLFLVQGAGLRQCDATGRVLAVLPGLWTSIAAAMALDPEGRRLAVGTREGSLSVLDAATGRRLAEAAPHRDRVTGLAFHPGEEMLASCSRDGTALLLDATTLEARLRLLGHSGPVTGLAFSPDGSRLATAGEDRVVRLWDVATGRQVATLQGHESPVSCLAWSPDGQTIATGDGGRDVAGRILLWCAARSAAMR